MKFSARLRMWLAIVAGALVLFTIAGFFVVPPIARSQIEQRLSQQLGRRVTLEKVRLNPFALSVTLQNFAIWEPDGQTRFLGWRELYVNVDALSSLWGEWVLDDIALRQFDARVVINADRSFNFSDLLAKFAAPGAPAATPSAPGRPLHIAHLQVSDTRVAFTDHSRPQPFATTVGPLNFTLADFRTESGRGAPYRFQAVTEAGEKLAWAGTLQAVPLRSAGELSLEAISLPKYAPYYADVLRADLTAGTLAVRGRYELDLSPDHRAMKFLGGAVQLRGFQLLERASHQPIVELPALDIAGIEVDALTLSGSVATIALDGGMLHVRRTKDGGINLLALAPPAAPAPATPAPASPRPDLTLGELAVKGFGVNVTDEAAAQPAHLALGAIALSVRNVSLKEGAAMPLHLAFDWAPKGHVQLDGTVALSPAKADLQLKIDGVELPPLSPYLEQFARVHLRDGAVSASLAATASLPAGGSPDAAVQGDVTLERLGLVDAAHNNKLAGFTGLTLRGLHARTSPALQVSLDEIAVAGPYARVIVNPDHSLNLATLLAAPAAAASTPAAPAAEQPAAPLPQIDIARITIADGDFRFWDRSIEPNVSMSLRQFAGTISGLSSRELAKGDVALNAVVDGSGPVAITGKLDPLGAKPTVDLQVDVKNVDLMPLSPYAGRYAGYELARGKLRVDVKLRVDGKQIDSANVVTLNQFTFGSPVASPDATSLPVRLGVALLKDVDGNIVIDLPVQGRTDDPNFKIGRVVTRVVVNLLTKAAVSPFSLIGAAFGGGGDELAFQEFAPGSADLQPSEVAKLETMTKALTNRPALSLDLIGSYDTSADAFALRERKLTRQIRRTIWETARAKDPNLAPLDQFTVPAEQEAAMVKKLFDEQFPPGTQFGTPLPQAPVVVAPPPPPAGWFKRLVRTITLRTYREHRAARIESERRLAAHQQEAAAAIAAGLPLDAMRARLAEALPIDDNELRRLASLRAQRVRDYFVNVGKIAPDRLFLAKDQTAAPKEGKGPRVFLSLQ